jgi:hydroxymethylbilane synthase
MTTLRIGTRGSALALWQSRHIAARLAALRPDIAITLVEIESTGDRVIDVPLSHVEGTGFFTAAIERALLDGQVDVAVHSCKDLPVAPTPGLHLAAIPDRGPVEDVLVARDGLTLARLPAGARVGTCSLRRTAQVRARRPDLSCVALRGNVPTRVARVTGGELDAIVLAAAGLARLGLDAHITERFAPDAFLPAPAQGALAVQCRADDRAVRDLLAPLDHVGTRAAVTAERQALHLLGGGCSTPVGALALTREGLLHLTAAVFDPADGRAVRAAASGRSADQVGAEVAQALLELGARPLLEAVPHALAVMEGGQA